MARRNASEQLAEAIEALMANPERPLPVVDPRLRALLRIAGDLRDLPSGEFKARLKAELLSEARRAPAQRAGAAAAEPDYGPPLLGVADYLARLQELNSERPLAAFDLRVALHGLPDRGSRFLASLNQCTLGVGVSRFSGSFHWERHPAADEMLHILEGEADVVTLTAGGPVRSALRAGSIFICPQGLWHRVEPRSASLSMFFATPGEGTEASAAPQPPARRPPRRAGRRDADRRAGIEAPAQPELVAHDLGSALRGLPELAITSSTTEQEAGAAWLPITSLGPCTLGVMRFSGQTPWERHPDGDELLHVLDGAVDVTVLTDRGPARVHVGAGSFLVCPKGLWHRQEPRPSVTLLFGTPTRTTEHSFADDPRIG
jgi:quercetin dioxygenase-like cupin family protein